MSHEIPWMNKKGQPESPVDILPVCFFQLISLNEEDEGEYEKRKSKKQIGNLNVDNINMNDDDRG
jgi:hypothetical protein